MSADLEAIRHDNAKAQEDFLREHSWVPRFKGADRWTHRSLRGGGSLPRAEAVERELDWQAKRAEKRAREARDHERELRRRELRESIETYWDPDTGALKVRKA